MLRKSITADLSHLINRSFESVYHLLIKLTNRPLFKRYLRREEISRDLSDCENSLRDALVLFSVSSEILQRVFLQVIANIIDFDSNPHT